MNCLLVILKWPWSLSSLEGSVEKVETGKGKDRGCMQAGRQRMDSEDRSSSDMLGRSVAKSST